MSHTPGPWTWNKYGDCWLEGSNGSEIIHVDASENTVPGAADARLIAAAPDLLEACKTAAEYIREIQSNALHPVRSRTLELIDIAIAKAEGK